MTLLQKRDIVLDSLRVQFRARVLEIIVSDVADDRVDHIALGSHDREIDPRLDAFLRDCASNVMQALAEEDTELCWLNYSEGAYCGRAKHHDGKCSQMSDAWHLAQRTKVKERP